MTVPHERDGEGPLSVEATAFAGTAHGAVEHLLLGISSDERAFVRRQAHAVLAAVQHLVAEGHFGGRVYVTVTGHANEVPGRPGSNKPMDNVNIHISAVPDAASTQ